MLNSIFRFRHLLAQALSALGIFVITLLVMCVSWQVISRFLLARPSTLTDELSRFLLIWLVLLGAAICTSSRSHLSIDLLERVLKPLPRRALEIYIQAMVGTFSVSVMVIGGLRMVATSSSMGEISPALQVPMGYVYSALPVSGILIFIFCLINLVDAIFGFPSIPTDAPSVVQEDHK